MKSIAYVRVSTQDQDLGVEVQKAAITSFAAARGLVIAAWFEERVSGAAEISDSPELAMALQAVREHKAEYFLVHKRDRLARDVGRAILLENILARDGCQILSAAGDNFTGPEGMFVRRLMDTFAEYERQVIKARTKAAIAVKKRRGERWCRHPPYGYRAEHGRILPDSHEQQVIARCHEWFLAGVPYREMIRRLGPVSRTGRFLTYTAVYKICRPLRAPVVASAGPEQNQVPGTLS